MSDDDELAAVWIKIKQKINKRKQNNTTVFYFFSEIRIKIK